MEYEHGAENQSMDGLPSMGNPNASATHIARADCPDLSDPEWEALQRLAIVIGEAAVATMLRTLSPTEQHGVAMGFIVKEQRDAAAATTTTASSGTTPRVQSLKLHVSNYVGKEGEPLLRWLVEVDIAIAARRIFDQPSKVAFAMSCRGGRARSWAYGRRHTGATCFSAYAEFKKELRQGFSLAILKPAAPCERDSHCKKHDDKPNLVILKIRSKREGSLRALVDSGALNNFVRQQSLPKLNFEDVDMCWKYGWQRVPP
ncbi:hypothetical protein PI124_g22048 [Phytophthora idaei]|nr:hypothetical protein PI125_g24571 [Phytophthora idaei]KAG3124847.1 hypothetical protein PI126_g23058 [Phytophthora idaei]KAG3232875.1 hypothetical protein PI124_g22048 [Phytophthora idaei]